MSFLMFLRIDPRDAEDLQWRFLCSDGEIRGVQARAYDESIFEPIEKPKELRCGLIFVGGVSREEPSYEMNEHTLDAIARQRRIDMALSMCTIDTRRALWLAYGEAIDIRLFSLGPKPKPTDEAAQPALCNLMEHAPAVAEFYMRTRTRRSLRAWLEHMAQLAERSELSNDTLRTLRLGAEKLFLKAAREYGTAARTLRINEKRQNTRTV